MEITYRRTVQVREYESITIEAKRECENDYEYAEDVLHNLEDFVDTEIIGQRDHLRTRHKQEEFADDEDLS
jgi:hypothetical protein